jgi:hypothetical protein
VRRVCLIINQRNIFLLNIHLRMIHDPNDPEFQESMKYLALPPEEKLKLRSQPFDAKKVCWVPDPKESFIAAEIESTKDDEVTVKTTKGDVSRFHFIELLQ